MIVTYMFHPINYRLLHLIKSLILLLIIVPEAAWSQTASGKSNLVKVKVTEQVTVNKPVLSYSGVVFEDKNKNQAIDPEEETSLSFTVKNEGKGISQNLLIKAYASNEIRGLNFGKEMKIDSIAPGKTQQITIPINSSRSLESGTANIIVEIKEEYEFDPDQIEINILTEELRR